jgi:hypothetical protein
VWARLPIGGARSFVGIVSSRGTRTGFRSHRGARN